MGETEGKRGTGNAMVVAILVLFASYFLLPGPWVLLFMMRPEGGVFSFERAIFPLAWLAERVPGYERFANFQFGLLTRFFDL